LDQAMPLFCPAVSPWTRPDAYAKLNACLLQACSASVFSHLALEETNEKDAHAKHEDDPADTHQTIVRREKVDQQLHRHRSNC
jgi:hypothetical protein